MRVIKTELPGVVIFEPKVFPDARGYFVETFRENEYAKYGVDKHFVQDNHSRSQNNVVRGLHYQLQQPQGKLVSVSRGEVFDVVLDIRLGSPTFGQWISVILNEKNQRRIYIPPGYAHGVCILSDIVDLHYKCTAYYKPGDEYGIAHDDPDLNIHWPVTEPIVSEKDKQYPNLNQQQINLLPEYEATGVLEASPA